MTAGERNCTIALQECIDHYGVDTLVSALKPLLIAGGYKVTKKVPRGAPRRVDRAAILALVKKNPAITSAEGAAIIGCSPDMFAKVRGNRA